MNTAKLDDQEQNPYVYSTYHIANARTIVDTQLELGSGTFYPQERMRPTDELAKTYRTLLSYQKQFNSFFTNPMITLKLFKNYTAFCI